MARAEATVRAIREATSSSSKLLAKYDLGAQLGVGWRSLVQLAYRKLDGERFACKTSLFEPRDESEFDGISQRICTEVECLRRLRGKRGVVTLEECIVGREVWHVVLELCDSSLADWMKQRRKSGGRAGLPEQEAAVIARCLASTIRSIHGAGILHRDVKPANILIKQRRGRKYLKLGDFGSAHTFGLYDDGKSEVTGPIGTPRYAAPDMFRGGYHFPVDVWSLGITIHQLLSGDSRPYRDYGSPDVLDELKSNYGDPREYLDWDGFSDGAKDLLEQMLDKEPENRPDLSAVLSHPWIAHHTAGIDRSSSSWVLPAEEDEEDEDEDED